MVYNIGIDLNLVAFFKLIIHINNIYYGMPMCEKKSKKMVNDFLFNKINIKILD